MGLNIELVKVAGATMRSRYSNRRSHKIDIEYLLSTGDSDFSQWIRNSLAYVKKELEELERNETEYAKPSN